MADTFDANGLTVETAADITSELVADFQDIYTAGINVGQNSADGQIIGIFTQASVDVREFLVSINASFDPDQAVGIILDQRVAINGIQRAGGTYSIFPVDISVNKTITLQGLDANFNSANGAGYTVTDGAGNNAILIDTTELVAGTTTTLNFRSQKIGLITLAINTLTVPVTIINGVTSVNNSQAMISTGADEETDVQLRFRRTKSVSLTSSGYLNGLRASLLALTGVIDAEVYENNGDSVDANGVPGHGIWAIVDGGANTDIAQTIFYKKTNGANMRGSVVVNELSDSGILVPIKFDRPTAENLYLKFSIKTTTTGYAFDLVGIKSGIASTLSYEVGAFAETSAPTAAAAAIINSLGGGGVPVLMQVSTDGATYTDFVEPVDLAHQFSVDPANISITVIA